MTILFHADDYGITAEQAAHMLALSSACGGKGALKSVSIFANSPAFEEAVKLAAPHVAQGALDMGLHVNLVEGAPCADPATIPLLVGSRNTFCNDFVNLLVLSVGPHRAQLLEQVERECTAQLKRYLAAFPQAQGALRLDSHQHTHAIPLVLDAVLASAHSCNCTLTYLRTPAEPLRPHLASPQTRKHLSPANLAKKVLLGILCRRNRKKLPEGCATSLFCGVLLSGKMEYVTVELAQEFEKLALQRARKGKGDGSVEVLFHPVSVARSQCLDPENEPFAAACASPGRDAEARTLSRL